MKKVIALVVIISMSFQVNAQQIGMIKYKETIKLQIEMDLPEGIDLSGMLPESQSFYKDLYFNQFQSVYKDAKENETMDTEMQNDDGSIQIKIQSGGTEEIYFTDLKEKKILHQKGFIGKNFLIEESLAKAKWKLTGEKVKYLGYECQKAISRSEEGETVAWFTTEIPVQLGPSSYNQLPGVILMLSTPDKKIEIMATEIVFNESYQKEIKAPTKGKKVSKGEFEEIVEDKTKEIEEMYGGQGVIIRN